MDAAKSEKIDLFLAPLDLTTRHGVPFSHLMHPLLLSGPLISGPELSKSMSPLCAFTSVILYRVRRITRELGIPDVFDMHDPLAVWTALVHASLPRGAPLVKGWAAERRDFVIECAGQYTQGELNRTLVPAYAHHEIKVCVLLTEGELELAIAINILIMLHRGGTDNTGGVRSVDGVQGFDKAQSKQPVGIKVLSLTPGLAVMEKEITEKLFWDLRIQN
jgi:hypothetical protein